MQHQYWVARQTVLRKLGTREDDCVVSSDAELDAKLELFRSIAESSGQLQRLVEQAGERSSVLAQEEASLGGFMRDAGSGGGGASLALNTTGKGIAFCGQTRSALRGPLARLHRELDTFRCRGVADTLGTVRAVERARDDYRAALSWMKAASARLDPDTGKGVHQFRKAQAQVKRSKQHFDKLTLDCLQKVDLLAAARCNMFSHALVNYHKSLQTFAAKASHTLKLTAKGLSEAPAYDFSILKELSQAQPEDANRTEQDVDKDQLLFFQNEFKDENQTSDTIKSTENADDLKDTSNATDLISVDQPNVCSQNATINADLADLNLTDDFGSALSHQLLQDLGADLLSIPSSSNNLPEVNDESTQFPKTKDMHSTNNSGPSKKIDSQKKDRAQWFKLFAELDPLANPDALPGANINQSHAA